MTKVVVNGCFGGAGLSPRAARLVAERAPDVWGDCDPQHLGYDAPRDDATLVAVVEELGIDANGRHAALYIVDVPDGVPWKISEYDGSESVSVDWKALCAEFVSASELDEDIARDRMVKALEWK